MPGTTDSKRLQQTIVIYSAIGMLLVGAMVGLVGVLPMTRQLREAQKRNLLVDLQRQTTAVEQYLSRARNAAAYVSVRSKTRERTDAFSRGLMSRDEFVHGAEMLLTEHMARATNNVAGIALFDIHSNQVVSVGHPIQAEHRTWPD